MPSPAPVFDRLQYEKVFAYCKLSLSGGKGSLGTIKARSVLACSNNGSLMSNKTLEMLSSLHK